MTLDQYLTKRGETAEAFARRIGAATSTVTRIRRGEMAPGLETLLAIQKATGGKVSARELVKPSPGRDKRSTASRPKSTGYKPKSNGNGENDSISDLPKDVA